MTKEKLFLQYERMINSASGKAARVWGLDFYDVQAQAFLIFMESLASYDAERAKFSTHLWTQLRRLNDYCAKEVKTYGRMVSLFENCACLQDEEQFSSVLDYIDAQIELSADAREILCYLVSGWWEEVPGTNRKPSLYGLKCKFTDWRPCRVEKAWNELKGWYQNNYGYRY